MFYLEPFLEIIYSRRKLVNEYEDGNLHSNQIIDTRVINVLAEFQLKNLSLIRLSWTGTFAVEKMSWNFHMNVLTLANVVEKCLWIMSVCSLTQVNRDPIAMKSILAIGYHYGMINIEMKCVTVTVHQNNSDTLLCIKKNCLRHYFTDITLL